MLKQIDFAALLLLVVGALNWGLVGLFKYDLVAEIVGERFGRVNLVSRIIYILVAASGLYLATHPARIGRPRDSVPAS
jgi:uncharacterized membrane protein YuzA (DUF378 family)